MGGWSGAGPWPGQGKARLGVKTGKAIKREKAIRPVDDRSPAGRIAVLHWCYVLCGGVLLSHQVSLAVPSALAGLASGFGMGPGVSPPP